MTFWEVLCLVVYSIIIAVLGVYGFHRYLLLRLFLSALPNSGFPSPTALPNCLSSQSSYHSTNEYHVVERLLEAVGQIDYPHDRLQIQILDDSQDETRDKAREVDGAVGSPRARRRVPGPNPAPRL